jgi:hypothetical protein
MTRRWIVTLYLATMLGAGCSLFEPQYVQLTKAQEKALVEELGKYSTANREAWMEAIRRDLGVEVVGIVDTAKGKILELSPPAAQVADEAGVPLIESIADNPTPVGIVLGVVGALAAALRIINKRKALAGRKP